MIDLKFDKYQFKSLVREAVEEVLSERESFIQTGEDEIGGIELAVKITGYTQNTLYGLVNKRDIPFIKRGHKLFFSKNDLVEWLKEGRTKPRSEIQKDLK